MKSLYWSVQRFNLCYMIHFVNLTRLYRQASYPFISECTSASIRGHSRNKRHPYPRGMKFQFSIYFIALNWAPDSLTSDEGRVSYKLDALQTMLDLVNKIQSKTVS